MKTLFFAVLLLALAGTATAAPDSAVQLRYTPSPGDSCSYDMMLNTGMAIQGMGTGASSSMHSVFTVRVTDTTGPQLGIDVGIAEMKASTRGAPGMRDTAIDLIPAGSMKLRVITDRRGNLLFAWPSEDLVRAYETREHLAGGGVQNSLRKIFVVYPADPVRPGTSWQQTTADTVPAGRGSSIITTMTSTLTYTGTTDTLGVHCARIALASDSISVTGQGDYQSSNLVVRGSGRMQGVYYMDMASGLPVAGVIQSNIDMIFHPSGPVDAPDRDNAPVHMYNTSDFVLRRKDSAR